MVAFLRFYGQDFDYTTMSIRFTTTSVKYGSKGWSAKRYELSLNDPADPSIELGSKVYAIKHVQATFKDAYMRLEGVIKGGAGASDREKARVNGVLGCVMGGDFAQFVEERKGMVRRWEAQGMVRTVTDTWWT